MSEEPDTAKQVQPVLMFDDKDRAAQKDVKDFRPITEYVERNHGRSRISDEPADPDNPFGSPDGIAPPNVTVGTESDEDGTTPPAAAPAPATEEAPGATDEDEDDIPSPWDDDTVD